MQGKICMITGANSGIGYETALALAKMGAHVVMVSRNRTKGEAAQSTIKTQSGNPSVDLLIADFSVQQSIHDLAAAFKAKYNRLDVLVNNAGGAVGKRQLTAEGYEMNFAVNHLGYFLLTNLLLDLLKASAPARIVNVTSSAQAFGKINFDDLMLEKNFRTAYAYSQSKAANIIFTYELAKRLAGTGVTANSVHPGAVRTNFGSTSDGFLGIFVVVARPFELSPEQGAQTLIYLASSPEVEGVTGKYYHKKRTLKSNSQTYDPAVQQRLWQVSEQLTNIAAQTTD
ncbi:MAG: SDR family oxidoreductase [Armatimonadetes bacterium]|nr:SDR family oxidoreductase [Anaerolineae bacterium]